MFKTYTNKLRTLSYYMGDIDRPRPILGILMDFILVAVALFSILYLWMVYRTRSPLLSMLLSIIVTALFNFALFLRKRTLYKSNRKRIRRHLAREDMADRLSLLSKPEFEWQLKRALSGIKGLEHLEQGEGYLKASYNGMPIAIGYHHAPPKGYETYEKVWSFYNSLRSRGYKSLLYISSGFFEEACKNLEEKDLDIPFTLFDIQSLLDLMEEAGMLPEEEMLDDLVEQKIAENIKKKKYAKNKVPPSYKLKRYMISSLFFLGGSFLFRSYFPFYFVLSILFFVLGLLSQVLSSDNKKYSSKIPQ